MPLLFQAATTSSSLYTRIFPSAVLFPPAVGTTIKLPSSPPANWMNFSMIPVLLVVPPPTITSVPLAGPYSTGSRLTGFVGDCCPPKLPVTTSNESKAADNPATRFLFITPPVLLRRDRWRNTEGREPVDGTVRAAPHSF